MSKVSCKDVLITATNNVQLLSVTVCAPPQHTDLVFGLAVLSQPLSRGESFRMFLIYHTQCSQTQPQLREGGGGEERERGREGGRVGERERGRKVAELCLSFIHICKCTQKTCNG